MSDIISTLRDRVRELELEAVAIRARHAEACELLAALENGTPRRGRPRKPELVERRHSEGEAA